MEGKPKPVAQGTRKVEGMFAVLRIREKELLEIKGPCGMAGCRLHDKHQGPCDIRKKKSHE